MSLQLEPYMNNFNGFFKVTMCHFAVCAIRRVIIWFAAVRNVLTILLDIFSYFLNLLFGYFIIEKNNN